MIKKISELDPIYTRLSSEGQATELTDEQKKNALIELSYKISEENEPPTFGYYGSYQTNLLSLETYLGIDVMKNTMQSLLSDNWTFKNDLWIGQPNSISSDLIDSYSTTDSTHGLSVFAKSEFDNSVVFHGRTDFHNEANFAGMINGVAYRAQWGDLAEFYSADSEYEPGTLVQFSGSEDVTIAKTEANGVVSTKPGCLLDSDSKTKSAHSIPIALCGKVPVKVVGKISKHDKIALSELPGIGRKKLDDSETTVAIALENSEDDGVKKILCVTKLAF